MRDLSDRQLEMLTLVASSVAERGFHPTIRELGDAMGIRSTNGVNDHLESLVRKGYVDRIANTARSLTLTPLAFTRLGAKLPLLTAARLALSALEAVVRSPLSTSDYEKVHAARDALRKAGIR